jgi:glycosyltransferase involved in cell wall biosynthesis
VSLAHVLATAVQVARAEGLRGARDRLLDRLADHRRDRRYRALAAGGTAGFATPILNVLATPPSPRFGGVPTQLLARLRVEARARPVALLYPTGRGYRLELASAGKRGRVDLGGPPLDPVACVDPAFRDAVQTSLGLVGASCVHVEGVAGLPLQTLCELRSPDRRLVISVHDFALFCARPHLMERPAERFCDYCRDLDRCGRCLGMDWDLPRGFQAERRAVAAVLLADADAVVYPSAFLRDRHADLFGCADSGRQHVIAPAVELPRLAPPGPPRSIRHIAYVGAVHPHKGALVFEEVVEALASTPGLRFTVYGGGEPRLLARLRRLPRVRVRGYYRAGSLPTLLRREQVDLALLLSVWPESYGITLDECQAAGVPVVAFDHGAIGERLRSGGGSFRIPLDRGSLGVAQAVAEASQGAAPGVCPRTQGPTPQGSAAALDSVYRSILPRVGPTNGQSPEGSSERRQA